MLHCSDPSPNCEIYSDPSPKHLKSDFEQTRSCILLLILLFIQPMLILLYCFSVRNTVTGPVFRVKIAIL